MNLRSEGAGPLPTRRNTAVGGGGSDEAMQFRMRSLLAELLQLTERMATN